MADRDGGEGLGVNANDVVAFFVELAALALLGLWGYRAGGAVWAQVLLGIALPLLAAILWGLFAAPRAQFRGRRTTLVVKVVVLGAAVLAGFFVLPLGWALVCAAVVVVNLVLMYVGPFAR